MARFGRVEPEPRALIHYCRQDPSAHKAWISPSLRKPSWDKPSLGSLKRIQTNVKKLEAKGERGQVGRDETRGGDRHALAFFLIGKGTCIKVSTTTK
uniref:Uncharacterized protein n=1 Tax=Picea glauca TaxID=3330 RepID=A0A101LVY3_PICGL|nr:hypothetical protein ABT39_MTgene1959 [Picea glauca]QHR92456.1 hypothetical protein Q903MT_gene6502 [Picea sitchensis]